MPPEIRMLYYLCLFGPGVDSVNKLLNHDDIEAFSAYLKYMQKLNYTYTAEDRIFPQYVINDLRINGRL